MESVFVSASASFGIVSVAIAAWVGVLEYRLKVQGERRLQEGEQRLQEGARSEMDIRLSKAFAELMWLANARGGSHVSEKCVEELFEKGMITKQDFDDPESLSAKLQTACVLTLPVGKACQDAAIASIAVLGSRHEVLREPARAALDSLKCFKKEEAESGLKLLSE